MCSCISINCRVLPVVLIVAARLRGFNIYSDISPLKSSDSLFKCFTYARIAFWTSVLWLNGNYNNTGIRIDLRSSYTSIWGTWYHCVGAVWPYFNFYLFSALNIGCVKICGYDFFAFVFLFNFFYYVYFLLFEACASLATIHRYVYTVRKYVLGVNCKMFVCVCVFCVCENKYIFMILKYIYMYTTRFLDFEAWTSLPYIAAYIGYGKIYWE